MTTYILKELPLNDDTLYIADDDKVFVGGYAARIEYFTYQNEWTDRIHVRHFRSLDTLQKYIDKNYPEFEGWA